MRKLLPLLFLASGAAHAGACLPLNELIKLDQQYEDAMRSGNEAFLQELLADDFVWVHNLASSLDGKAAILARARQPSASFKARNTSEVQGHITGDTAVLRGLSSVEQWNADGKTWKTARYQFMRTYVNVAGKCKLLAVQTMKLWSSEGKSG